MNGKGVTEEIVLSKILQILELAFKVPLRGDPHYKGRGAFVGTSKMRLPGINGENTES